MNPGAATGVRLHPRIIEPAMRFKNPDDYAKQNIRLNAVMPGNIEPPMVDRFTGGDTQKAIGLEPVGRLGKPEEIAEAVLWMAPDLGGIVTGAATVMDRGSSL